MRILIIDDDPLVRDSLTMVLASVGHDTVTAAAAIEGIERAEDGSFDVALIDMKMPGLDGLEAVKGIMRLEPPIPVVGMSGGSLNADIDYAVLAVRLGAKAFLKKPFTRAQLLDAIEPAKT